MSKNKLIVFVVIIIISISSITLEKLHNSSVKKGLEIKEMFLEEGDYIVNKDVASGYYDIEVTEGDLQFCGRAVSQGDKIIGYEFLNKNHILLKGSGKVKIIPASYKELILSNGSYKIQNSGNYIIGKQIEKGKYIVSYVGEDAKKPFVQVLSEMGEVEKSYDFLKENSYEIILTESNVLQINKGLFEEYKNYYILLQLIK